MGMIIRVDKTMILRNKSMQKAGEDDDLEDNDYIRDDFDKDEDEDGKQHRGRMRMRISTR